MAETDVEKLESQWTLLDELWMSVRHHVQVVHDIEYGYGDPLRTKVCPFLNLLAIVCADLLEMMLEPNTLPWPRK